jgi:3-oxoacyl-[acyl-carrier protein] reductase
VIDLGLGGKRAIVAGAGYRPERAGHGRGTALQLAAGGATVACIDISKDRAHQIVAEIEANGGKALPLIADMTSSAESNRVVAEAVGELGGVDIAIDIIGAPTWGRVATFTDEAWNWSILNNLTQVFFFWRAVAGHMITQGTGGALAALTSVDGLQSAAYHVAYGAAKAGLISMTKTFAEELGPHGVRANVVAPGNVGRGNWDEEAVPFGTDQANPLAPPRPMDIANGLVYLCSDLAVHLTGQVLTIDGGATTKSPWGFEPGWVDHLNELYPGPGDWDNSLRR